MHAVITYLPSAAKIGTVLNIAPSMHVSGGPERFRETREMGENGNMVPALC